MLFKKHVCGDMSVFYAHKTQRYTILQIRIIFSIDPNHSEIAFKVDHFTHKYLELF